MSVIPADADGILKLVIEVASLQHTVEFFRDRDIRGTGEPEVFTVTSKYVQDLTLEFVQAP